MQCTSGQTVRLLLVVVVPEVFSVRRFRTSTDVVFSCSPGYRPELDTLTHRGHRTARRRNFGPSSLNQYSGKILVSS
ncbi:MAG: hypothetical protein BWX71_02133 [Deltaproteobacteria bacterium ADurb.Bin072]|nr:MAG: hypothetical protein BWX71_02133 [Deltaproteobacteria bacterium ADurb.Bin072]